jgi:hypothetical protein
LTLADVDGNVQLLVDVNVRLYVIVAIPALVAWVDTDAGIMTESVKVAVGPGLVIKRLNDPPAFVCDEPTCITPFGEETVPPAGDAKHDGVKIHVMVIVVGWPSGMLTDVGVRVTVTSARAAVIPVSKNKTDTAIARATFVIGVPYFLERINPSVGRI